MLVAEDEVGGGRQVGGAGGQRPWLYLLFFFLIKDKDSFIYLFF